ncbi:phospholipase D/Transphosphatidylase [Petrotoga mobilis SJ95]|uniref:Cardiolipin synthase n=1 Tax=Petrotoga mobilis (strain DSM 10674 / SJ95) TaxID=403833 RepID=A9BG60_PETMO|nr:cardiolipin synthase [Petrotoga mobilis]ABX31816.1 phospholipase D/Transphosphatidylase [Petrotoga mobilis SJ95]
MAFAIIFKFGFWTFFVLIYAFVATTVIILERKRPEKTISWLLIFAVIPLIGFVIYLFFGRNWKRRKLTSDIYLDSKPSLSEEEEKWLIKVLGENDTQYLQLINLLKRNSKSPLFLGNDIEIFNNGKEKFSSFFKEIENAKESILLEYYIVKDDETGNKLKDLLIKKAKEGVEIKFIMDKIGSGRLKKSYIKQLKSAGVEIAFYSYFLSPVLKFLNTQVNYRNHRKIAIIDSEIGFIGGINIGNEYIGKSSLGYWRDLHLKVRGEAVNGLQKIFFEDYQTIVKAERKKEKIDPSKYFKKQERKGDSLIQIAVSGPESENSSIMQTIHKMITIAKDHIYIATPYFIPDDSILSALKIAALSGVKVKILFPGKMDHFLVYFASRTYLEEIIKYGVEVYFYRKDRFIHSKFVSIDGLISTVGTANIDIRSFELNYEANLLIYDREKTKQIEDIFHEDLKISSRISQDYFNAQPFLIKFTEAFCKIFSNLL